MRRAATGDAAGGQAALAAKRVTDPPIPGRVAVALPGQIGGTTPAAPEDEPLCAPGGYLERRVFTPLRYVRADPQSTCGPEPVR
jgi:hypothetical protein